MAGTGRWGTARQCAGCRGPRGPVCPTCAPQFQGPAYPVVRRAAPGLPPTYAAAIYDGPVREAIVAFKDHGRWALRSHLGVVLARAVAGAVADLVADGAPGEQVDRAPRVALVGVPGSPGSVRARDGDHVGELAAQAARVLRRTGIEVSVVRGLVGVRRRRDQVGLGHAERAANLSGSMRATEAVVGLTGAVLVDDLVTTGATLAEAARALRAAGVEPLGAGVLAATRGIAERR